MSLFKNITYTITLLFSIVTYAQLDSGLLVGLTTGTTSEINATTTAAQGALVFNTDDNKVYVFDCAMRIEYGQHELCCFVKSLYDWHFCKVFVQ